MRALAMETPTTGFFRRPSRLHQVVVLRMSQAHCSRAHPHASPPPPQVEETQAFFLSWVSLKFSQAARLCPSDCPHSPCTDFMLITCRAHCPSSLALTSTRGPGPHPSPWDHRRLPPSNNCSSALLSISHGGLAAISGL